MSNVLEFSPSYDGHVYRVPDGCGSFVFGIGSYNSGLYAYYAFYDIWVEYTYRAFLDFDLVLPKRCIIEKVELKIYLYDKSGNNDVYFNRLLSKASTYGVSSLFSAIFNGYNYNSPILDSAGWVTINLGAQAIQDILNNNRSWLSLGIMVMEDPYSGGVVYDYFYSQNYYGSTYRPKLLVTTRRVRQTGG